MCRNVTVIFIFEFIVQTNSIVDHIFFNRVDDLRLKAVILFIIQNASSHSIRIY
jgi:hypothetical protein